MRDFGKKITSSTLVSIIIDTFYRPKMLENAVTHILQQTYKNIELVIVNNGATKETIDFIEYIKNTDSRIKIVNFTENQFSWEDPQMLIRICLNAGLDATNGDLVFYQSDDDWVAIDFIERMVKLFVNNEKCITAIGRVVNSKPDGTIINFCKINKRNTYLNGVDLALDVAQRTNKFTQPNPGHSYVIKKDLLIRYGKYQDIFESHQLFGIIPFGDTGFDPDALMYWGRHNSQLNSIGTRKIIFWDKYMVYNLENFEYSFYNIWEKNFGIENAIIIKKYCHSIITSGYYQTIFTYIFKYKFYACFAFVKEYNLRLKPINKKFIYKFIGLKEAFVRTQFYYYYTTIPLFFTLCLKATGRKRIYNYILNRYKLLI